ncbi:MAG: hypothetical protein KGQ42_03985 [Alphaproteobacteria bacterium]|nr:hypothetical protein [Alphaproteobacteria bacterium]MDE2042233.1 hypothetical protein [Alphaproteobacteria bacterium]MDE2340442.1 hypothetical protein [Alphaproteobacteria bacterium]
MKNLLVKSMIALGLSAAVLAAASPALADRGGWHGRGGGGWHGRGGGWRGGGWHGRAAWGDRSRWAHEWREHRRWYGYGPRGYNWYYNDPAYYYDYGPGYSYYGYPPGYGYSPGYQVGVGLPGLILNFGDDD